MSDTVPVLAEPPIEPQTITVIRSRQKDDENTGTGKPESAWGRHRGSVERTGLKQDRTGG